MPAACCSLFFTSCGLLGGLPERTARRLPTATTGWRMCRRSPSWCEQWTSGSIEIRELRADGPYLERAILFTHEGQTTHLESYNYDHWIYPPPYLIQQHMVRRFRESRLAPTITDDDRGPKPAFVISGRIVRFEQTLGPGTALADVELELEVASSAAGRPVASQDLSRRGARNRPVDGRVRPEHGAGAGTDLCAVSEGSDVHPKLSGERAAPNCPYVSTCGVGDGGWIDYSLASSSSGAADLTMLTSGRHCCEIPTTNMYPCSRGRGAWLRERCIPGVSG